MEYIGIDVHKNQSQICILTEEGEITQQRIKTERMRLEEVLGGDRCCRILIEASTESEWVARCLEALGHEVVVADPNYAPMYGQRNRRAKTDRRDAEALAIACRMGTYRRAHRVSDEQRHRRAMLSAREALVRTRVRYIGLIRALLRRQGFRVPSGTSDSFKARVEKLQLPSETVCEIRSLLTVLEELNRQIEGSDQQVEEMVRQDQAVQRLSTAPGVGLLTAAAFVSVVDEVGRFSDAHQLESYLGLTPREMSSGEKQHRGTITKMGNGRLRWMLVESAWCIVRSRRAETWHLRRWTERIALRRGNRVALVGLARKLAGILYAMLRDGTVYTPPKMARPVAEPSVVR
jgi:transposase